MSPPPAKPAAKAATATKTARRAASGKPKPPSSKKPKPDSMLDEALADAVTTAKKSIDEWAKLAKGSLHRATTGAYDADSMAKDMTAMWGLVVSGGAAAIRVSQAVATALPTQFTAKK